MRTWIRAESGLSSRARRARSQAFAHQVKAFVRTGKLTEEQAELLLVGAYGIIDQP